MEHVLIHPLTEPAASALDEEPVFLPDAGGEVVPLNPSERLYLSFEGVVGSIAMVYAVRFASPVTAENVRVALREVVRAHPRLRGVIERTFFGHRMRVRRESATIDVLFENAFRVTAPSPTDDAALAEPMALLLNEPFAVERDLPIRARFIPHPERPVLILSVHHIAGDARSMMRWVASLLRVLNGEALAYAPVDSPDHLSAVAPRTARRWLGLLVHLVGSLGVLFRRPPMPLRLPRRKIAAFAPMGILPLQASAPLSALLRAARVRGTTLTTLVFAALSVAFRRVVGETAEGYVRARVSIDLRDFFPEGRRPGDGNYVSSFFVDAHPRAGFDATVREIDASMRSAIERFRKRLMLVASFAAGLQTRLGRKLFSRFALAAKLRDRLPRQSVHLSNLGRVEALDQGPVRVDAVFPSLAHYDLYVGVLGLGDRLQLSMSFPRGEIDEGTVRALLREVDAALLAEAVPPRSSWA